MGQHYIASEDSKRLQSKGVGPGYQPPSVLVPVGICHAVAEGEDRTVCGIDLARLVPFEDLPWRGGFRRLCLDCRAVVPS
jgi:hypothetical protein